MNAEPTPDGPPIDLDLDLDPDLDPGADVAPAPGPEPDPEPDPPPPPRFESRALWTHKRGNAESEYEDGFVVDPGRGVVAVADGATDGVFTRRWVARLLEGYGADPVPLNDPEAVAPWIAAERKRWFDSIDYPSLRWSLQRKVDRSCASATLLALHVGPADPGRAESDWVAWAVGDVCLFHVRDGALIDAFPVARSDEFGYAPAVLPSRDRGPLPPAAERRGTLRPGDTLAVATDAVAARLLSAVEQGEPPDWDALWRVEPADWTAAIEADRDAGRIVNDDCTLVVVRLAPQIEPEAEPEVSS